MGNSFLQDVEDFFNEVEEDIVDAQKAVAHDAMRSLFNASPHYNSIEDKNDNDVLKNQFQVDIDALYRSSKWVVPFFEHQLDYIHPDVDRDFEDAYFSGRESVFHPTYGEIFLEEALRAGKYNPTQSSNSGAFSALGRYDANHKVTSNNQGQTAYNPATYSYTLSKILNQQEATRIDNVEKLGDTITIENIVSHANNVETGEGWKRDGYFPYEKAANYIRAKYEGILDES